MAIRKILRCVAITGAILIVLIIVVEHDALFPVVVSDIGGTAEFSFKCLDKASGSPAAGVKLACFFEGKQIASAPWPEDAPPVPPGATPWFIAYMRVGAEGSTKDGRIGGVLIYPRSTRSILFFTIHDDGVETRKKPVKFVFSHPSYRKETRTYVIGDLGGDTVVELAPVEPGEMP